MIVSLDSRSFQKDMMNIMNYSIGFLDGIHQGKKKFMNTLGASAIELLKNYIDTNARVNPAILHHVYEWNQVGSPSARLYDLDYTISSLGLSIRSSFRQSLSVKDGSRVPFYNKATIIENGIPVTIRPRRSDVLAFEDDGQTVFTRKPVEVLSPGGEPAKGGFEKTFDDFFTKYFSQAFLYASGIGQYLENPVAYKKNLPAGRRSGRYAGVKAGYRWIANAGVTA